MRPRPPASMADALFATTFEPAPDVLEWIRSTILDPAGPLHNEEHGHLADAVLGVLWASNGFVKRAKLVVGTAEKPQAGPTWSDARRSQQLRQWFGRDDLDFIITLDAHHCAECSDVAFCALVEHELYHCGHARDEFGIPKYGKDGQPVLAMRAHDVEEFVGVVRRYGVGHPDGPLAELIMAAAHGPQVEESEIRHACGACLARV